MRALTILLSVVIVALFSVAGVIAWDYFKIGRTIPASVAPAARANLVLVEKQARRLTLLRDGRVLKIYDIALGGDPVGHKQEEGDSRTPEGAYAIDFKNPRSRFHLSLRVSYPNAADRSSAQQRSVPPGGDIMIHGRPNGLGLFGGLVLTRDWTDGCIAVTNGQIEEIWSMVDLNTAIEIKP